MIFLMFCVVSDIQLKESVVNKGVRRWFSDTISLTSHVDVHGEQGLMESQEYSEYTVVVPKDHDGQRLDVALTELLPSVGSRSMLQRLIEQGDVRSQQGSLKASYRVQQGDCVTVRVPPPTPAIPVAEAIPLVVLYEDTDLLVIDKPPGMSVHPGAGIASGTLVNALLHHCEDLSGIGGEIRPGIVHRLDKGTSGVLVVAKNDMAHRALAKQFEEHTVKRIYQALIYGSPAQDTGKIQGIIGRHPSDRLRMSGSAKKGKQAATNWRVLARYGPVSLVQLRLETGRTHQIRVHLSENGMPLLGDPLYLHGGRLATLKDQPLRALIHGLTRQALHAKTLGFIHPVSGEYLEFSSEFPEDIRAVLAYLLTTYGGAADE